TATSAVHHRCITGTAFGAVWRNRRTRRNRLVEPKTGAEQEPGGRIRLRGLLREKPLICRGFSYSWDSGLASRGFGASPVHHAPQTVVCLMSRTTQPTLRRTRRTFLWSSSHVAGVRTRRAPATRAVADASWTQRSAFAPRSKRSSRPWPTTCLFPGE